MKHSLVIVIGILLSWEAVWKVEKFCKDRVTENPYTGQVIIPTTSYACSWTTLRAHKEKLVDNQQEVDRFKKGCSACENSHWDPFGPEQNMCCRFWSQKQVDWEDPYIVNLSSSTMLQFGHIE